LRLQQLPGNHSVCNFFGAAQDEETGGLDWAVNPDRRWRSRGAFSPESCRSTSLCKQRVQGMPGASAAPIASHPMETRTRVSHYRLTESIGIPCAMVLTGYVVRAPVRPAFVSPSPAVIEPPAWHLPLGCQAHTPSPSANPPPVKPTYQRPSHPASNVRDDAYAPLQSRRDAATIDVIYEKRKSYYFR
jgi:hypothetical protein